MKAQMLAAVLLLGSPTLAFAVDNSPPPVDFNWTGGYVGAQVGYVQGNSAADYPLVIVGVSNIDPDGWLGGVYIGYNYQLDSNIVLGFEADAVYSTVNGRGQFDRLGIGLIPGAFDSLDLNWSGAVRGRVGYAAGRFLPYIAAGVAFGDVDVAAEDPGPGYVGSWNATYIGYTVAAGAEYAVTDNVVFRAEYRFTDFGSKTFTAASPTSAHQVDLSTHDVRFGIAYKF